MNTALTHPSAPVRETAEYVVARGERGAQALERPRVDTTLYVAALEHAANLPGVKVVFIQGDDDSYFVFGDGALTVARAIPGVAACFDNVLGRRVAVAAIPVDAVGDAQRALYRDGVASARADRIDAGKTAVTHIARPRRDPSYEEQDKILKEAARFVPRPVRCIVARLLDMNGASQRLAMRTVCRWLADFDGDSILPPTWRPALPGRAVLGRLAEMLAALPEIAHKRTVSKVREVQALQASDQSHQPRLRLAHEGDHPSPDRPELVEVAARSGGQRGA